MANIKDIRDTVNAPQRAYEFEVAILGNGALPILTNRVQNVSIPETSVETIEINFKSSKTIYAGRDASPHTVTVTFFDDETRATYTFFKNWMNQIRNPVDGSGEDRGSYAASMVITTFKHDESTITGVDTMTKVFPTTVGEVTLSYDTSDHFTFDVTFSFDERITSAS